MFITHDNTCSSYEFRRLLITFKIRYKQDINWTATSLYNTRTPQKYTQKRKKVWKCILVRKVRFYSGMFYVKSTADLFDFTQYAVYSARFYSMSDPIISSPVPTMGHLDIICIHFPNGKWERASIARVVLPLWLTLCKSMYDIALSVNWFFRTFRFTNSEE